MHFELASLSTDPGRKKQKSKKEAAGSKKERVQQKDGNYVQRRKNSGKHIKSCPTLG